jgi:hypothetical protein
MFDVNEILARLQNGDSAEDLAAEMSKALNAAEAKFQEAKEKAVAEAKALEKEAKLNDLAETILLAIDEYISVKCPEAMDNEGMDMSVAEFREILDGLLDTMVKMKNLFGDFAMEFAPIPVKEVKTEPKAPKKLKTADDKIADFLKTMGW